MQKYLEECIADITVYDLHQRAVRAQSEENETSRPLKNLEK